MAYTALHDGDEKGAFEVPHRTDAYCLECGERMRVWREGADGTARHFKHVSNMSGGGESGSLTNCSGGESDQHQTWKNFAAERASEVFENSEEVTVEKRVAAPHTDKKHRDADAAVMFEQRDEQLGLGLAIEVQHKNRAKDIAATTKDYIKQDIAVAWLDKDDFWQKGCRLTEIDFRDRAQEAVSVLPFDNNPVPWWLHINTHVEPELETIRTSRKALNWDECDHELKPRERHTPAKIPAEYFDEHAQQIWRDQDWRDVFSGVDTPHYIAQASIPEVDVSANTTIKLPSDYFTWLRRWYWLNTSFEQKLSPPREYDFTESYQIEAAYPHAWDVESAHCYHLREHNADRACGKCNSTATVYAHNFGFRCGHCGPYPNKLRES